jgi:anti-sigma factor RsiW
LTCYRTRRRIGAYLDGALDEQASRVAAAHVAACATCGREADSLRRLRTMLRVSLDAPEPDWNGFWPGIARGIQDARAPSPVPAAHPWFRGWSPPRLAFGALAAAAIIALGVWQFAPGPSQSEAGVMVSSAATEDPRATLIVYSTPERDVAVVWVFGLE